MKLLIQGWKLVWKSQELRPYFVKPVLWSLAGYFALLVGGWLIFAPSAAGLAARIGLPQEAGFITGTGLFLFLWVLISGPVFLAISGLASAFHWEPLGRKVELIQLGSELFPSPTVGRGLVDGLQRLPMTLICLLVLVTLGWTCFGLTAVLIGGFLALSDFPGPMLLRRGLIFPQSLFKSLRLPGAIPFGLVAGVLNLFPFVAVLLHPWLAATAALMVLEDERRTA